MTTEIAGTDVPHSEVIMRIESGGLSLALHKYGHGPLGVLAVHGLSGTGFDWSKTASALGDRWTVFALDMRGFGESDIDPQHDYSPSAMAKDIVAACAQLPSGPPLLVGHSYGGKAAIAAAGRDHPAICGLAVVDTGPVAGPGAVKVRERIQNWPEEFPDRTTARRQYRNLYAAEPEDQYHQRMDRYLTETGDGKVRIRRDPWWKEVWAAGLAHPAPPAWTDWEAVRAPTLLVRGELSEMLTEDTAHEMVDRNPHARLVEIAGVGHNITSAAPHRLAEVLATFHSEL